MTSQAFKDVMLKEPDHAFRAKIKASLASAQRQGRLPMVRYYRDLLAALDGKEQLCLAK